MTHRQSPEGDSPTNQQLLGRRGFLKVLGGTGAAAGAFALGVFAEKFGWLRFLGGNRRRTPESTNTDPQYVKEAHWLSPLNQTADILNIPIKLQLNNGAPEKLVAVLTVQHQNDVSDPTINANGGWPIADIVDLTGGQTEILNLALNFDHPNLRDNPIKVGDQFTLAVNIHQVRIDAEGNRIIDPHGQLNVAGYLRLTRGPAPIPQPPQ